MKRIPIVCLVLLVLCGATHAQTTGFTYQGRLVDNAVPANGTYEMRFRLFDADTGGTQMPQPAPITLDFTTANGNAVAITNGSFTVKLDFGELAFPGPARFLEISVRRAASDAFVPLNPRQQIASAPYNIKSLSAQSSDISGNSLSLGGVAANQYVVTTDSRMSDARTPTAGSTNYIQNNPSGPQPASSFNISGDGAVGGILTARLNAVETEGFSVAVRARNLATSASQNVAIEGQSTNGPPGFGTGGIFTGGSVGVMGHGIGTTNTAATYGVRGIASGSAGSRVGVGGFSTASTGVLTGTGLFGAASGPADTNYGVHGLATGATTNWAGYFEGNTYISGNLGIAVNSPTERLHVSGNGLFTGNAVAEGTLSGSVVNSGSIFTIGGTRVLMVTGPSPSQNVFVGVDAGNTNTTGTLNSFVGTQAGLSTAGGQQNSFFGGLAGKNNASGNGNSYFGVGAGSAFIAGDNNSFFGIGSGTGGNPISGSGNSFFGSGAGLSRTSGDNNSLFGTASNASSGISNATAIGYRAFVALDNSVVLGSIAGVNGATVNTNVGIGLINPTHKLHLVDAGNAGLRVQTNSAGGTVASFGGNGAFDVDGFGMPGGRLRAAEDGTVTIGVTGVGGNLTVFGNTLLNTLTIANGLTLNVLGTAGPTPLCRNALGQVATCSSSVRYKEKIDPFSPGFEILHRLRPVTFNWKADNKKDIGLVAEEVAEVEPLLVTYNENGEVEGVKYDRLGVLLINVVKEQQQRIADQNAQIRALDKQVQQQQESLSRQQQQIDQQRSLIDGLRRLVCTNLTATVCTEKQ